MRWQVLSCIHNLPQFAALYNNVQKLWKVHFYLIAGRQHQTSVQSFCEVIVTVLLSCYTHITDTHTHKIYLYVILYSKSVSSCWILSHLQTSPSPIIPNLTPLQAAAIRAPPHFGGPPRGRETGVPAHGKATMLVHPVVLRHARGKNRDLKKLLFCGCLWTNPHGSNGSKMIQQESNT